MKYRLKRLIQLIFSGGGIRVHSSQYGEDIFLHKFFKRSPPGFYIDVGAHHPFSKSNTVYLWARGWNGVNVDPSLKTIKLFKKYRKNDTNINAAVIQDKEIKLHKNIEFFYNDEIDAGATCDKGIAKVRGLKKTAVVNTTSIKILINKAISKYSGSFDLLNIDIEGLDEFVIHEMDEWIQKPKVLMIEIFSNSIHDLLQKESVEILLTHGYKLYQRVGHTAIFINVS